MFKDNAFNATIARSIIEGTRRSAGPAECIIHSSLDSFSFASRNFQKKKNNEGALIVAAIDAIGQAGKPSAFLMDDREDDWTLVRDSRKSPQHRSPSGIGRSRTHVPLFRIIKLSNARIPRCGKTLRDLPMNIQ